MPWPHTRRQKEHRRGPRWRGDGGPGHRLGDKEEIFPAWAKKLGHDFLGDFEEAGYIRLFVKKAK